MDKYFEVKNKYLAEGLAFLGFRYMKFSKGNKVVYSFEDTTEIKSVMNELIEMKNKLNLI